MIPTRGRRASGRSGTRPISFIVIAQKFDQARVRSFHHHNLKLCARLTNQRADIRARLRRVTRADLIAQERGDDRFLLITTVIELLKPEFGFDLYVNSDFPLSSGLGGSTALVSAIIGCFNEFRRDPLDNYEIAELAFQAERVTLNMSGGWQDQYATVFGGLNYLEFTSDDNVVHPLRLADETRLELESNLLLCFSNQQHDSAAMTVAAAGQASMEFIDEIGDLTQRMKSLLLKGRLNEFGRLLGRTWSLKRGLADSVSNPRLDAIYAAAISAGALGGRLLGAGGGGHFLFFVNPPHRQQVESRLTELSVVTTPFELETRGLQSWRVKLYPEAPTDVDIN